MKLSSSSFLWTATVALGVLCQSSVVMAQSDYIPEAPPTVYEADMMSPQTMDFDKTNNMFVAHPGWYNDKQIHYYKFRMYTPGTYSGLFTMTSTNMDVPIQKIYFVTTTGDFTGVIGSPIIEYHTSDGNLYSDYMQVVFVDAPMNYVIDTYKSVGDVMMSGTTTTESDIILNIPVVPTDSTLQHPVLKGTNPAPISPTPVYYKGVEVWTYVFEVTDESAEEYFTPKTRTTTTTDMMDYAITVTPFADPTVVKSAPLWHINQYSNGVMEGMGGGPDPNGMRNIIHLDRADDGYSPLWEILWVTQVPINFMSNQVSHREMITTDNGFAFIPTPMYVNCPDIGPIGDVVNPDMISSTDDFQKDVSVTDDNIIQGSGMMLIMQYNETVEFKCDTCPTSSGSTATNMMGAFEFVLDGSELPDAATELAVLHGGDGSELFKFMITSGDITPTMTNPTDAPVMAPTMAPIDVADGCSTLSLFTTATTIMALVAAIML